MQYSLFDPPRALSISDITAHIRHLLEVDDVLQDVWLEGEVSNWRPANSGHIYFTLKDEKASIRCVIWRSTAKSLRYLPRGDGEAVQAHGKVSVYEASGAYQLYVDLLEPVGQGALYAQYERLKQTLADEDLFDAALKQPLPVFPHRIGIVTSAQAAALRDILNVLSRRYPLSEVILSSSLVQGEEAPRQIIEALLRLLELDPPVDVIILARGGGSIEDLWAFNDELLARTIVASQIPIVTGVGHETDFTIADFVADQRAPTPSAAAELVTPDIENLAQILLDARYRLQEGIRTHSDEAHTLLEDRRWRLQQQSPQKQIDNRRQQVDEVQTTLDRLIQHRLSIHQERLSKAQARLKALGPKATLARGYAIVQKEGQLIRRVSEMAVGDRVEVMVADGAVETEIIRRLT